MNKKEFSKEIASKTGLSVDKGMEFTNAFIDIIKEQLIKGERVQFVGFGTFETTKRAARTGRNPRTGEDMLIKGGTIPKFKPGKQLKDAVNE